MSHGYTNKHEGYNREVHSKKKKKEEANFHNKKAD